MNKYGVLAKFKNTKSLLKAAQATKEKGYTKFDVYSPFPIHGMDDAMGLKPSIIGWLVLCGGAFGATFAFGLQTWVATSAYKLTISGKPMFSYQAFIPVTFELMVLCAAFAAVFGMFAVNKLPEWYHSLFKVKDFKTASSHDFFISIESNDPKYNAEEIAAFFKELGGVNIKEIDK